MGASSRPTLSDRVGQIELELEQIGREQNELREDVDDIKHDQESGKVSITTIVAISIALIGQMGAIVGAAITAIWGKP